MPSSCGRFSDALSALWSTRDEHARAWKGFVDAALHTCPSLLTPVMDGHARAGAVRGALMDLYAGPRFPTAPGEAEGGLTAVDEDFACPSLALPLDPRGGGAEQAYRSFRLRQRALELGSLAKVHEGRGRREHPAETFLAVGLLSGERPAAARPEWRAAS